MAIQKKHGKGRLDKYYRLAKEKGYRARAAFKLIQLNKKYHVLEKSRVVLDLCAAPGSWCQVASEVTPIDSLIIGVDLAPIKPLPRVITFQSDITTAQCRATIRQHIKHLKADLVLHDGAPNVGTAWVQDAFTQAELVLQSLRLATDFLRPGGSFITKIFRSRDYNSLLWVFNQLFRKVEATKPPSSRDVSAEIFVVCLDYKAPKKIDPRLLDPRSVFAELAAPVQNNEARVFNPEQKKRKRQGYEEGDWTQFKEVPVSEFIQTLDPIAILGTLNRLSFEHRPNGDLALSALEQLPETTQEIRDCCADLKVLGRKEFRALLRWRLKVRERFGFSQKQRSQDHEEGDEVGAVESMDDEMKAQEDMQRLKDQNDARKRKEKRKDNDRKRKELVRLQMNMTTPDEIGLEQLGPVGEDSMFGLRAIERANAANQISRGKMHSITPRKAQEQDAHSTALAAESESDDGDDLEDQLDEMYEEYQERRAERDPKYRSKKSRQEHEDDFQGFSENDEQDVSSDEDIVQDQDSDTDSSEDEGTFHGSSGENTSHQALSRRAANFFDQDIFQGIDIGQEDKKSFTNMPKRASPALAPTSSCEASQIQNGTFNYSTDEADRDNDDGDGFEVVKTIGDDERESWSEERTKGVRGKPDIDIITAEAMTLAHSLATGKQTRQSLIDDNFNKYTLRDTDGLPDWFLDDEDQHSKLQRPITKEAAAAIKEKLRALNARPIKKVAEAKARKKFKAAQRLEKLKKKSALLVEDDDMTEKDKAQTIQKLMSKAAKKKPRKQVSVVVARGGNRAISGRPRGTKGKYKMVDARLKKDARAAKRVAKKQKR